MGCCLFSFMSEEIKPHLVKSHDISLDVDYVEWIHDIKQRYRNAQIKAAVKVMENNIDLKSLKLQQVGAEITENQKLQQPVAELEFPPVFGFVPWGHHIEIITKCKTIEEALFYVQKTIEESWSRSALIDCMRADMYRSVGNAITNYEEKLPAIQGRLAQEIVKDTYDFGFVSLLKGYDEEELEDALLCCCGIKGGII
jgi:predicted nuclease of restriction endonuclease-like (RecB) superfamily